MKSNVSQNEIEMMGHLLQRQYGVKAVTVAELMANQHLAADDASRADLWTAVKRFLIGARPALTTFH